MNVNYHNDMDFYLESNNGIFSDSTLSEIDCPNRIYTEVDNNFSMIPISQNGTPPIIMSMKLI